MYASIFFLIFRLALMSAELSRNVLNVNYLIQKHHALVIAI